MQYKVTFTTFYFVIDNWKTQIRKGYLELCILGLIEKRERLYGFDMLEQLSTHGLQLNEGTLYPILNRMAADGLLSAAWDTKQLKGHPRKFYSLTKNGIKILEGMKSEFEEMYSLFKTL